MAKIVKRIIDIIFVLIIIVLVGYYILRITDKIEIFSVRTGSMEDGIHVGDYVVIYKKGTYGIGDIITYRKEDYYITHRIIKTDNGKIITKGDANNTEDAEIGLDSVVGKVIYIGGILNILINYKYIIVGLLLSLYLFSCYFDNKDKKVDKENEPKEETPTEIDDSTKNTENESKETPKLVEASYSELKEAEKEEETIELKEDKQEESPKEEIVEKKEETPVENEIETSKQGEDNKFVDEPTPTKKETTLQDMVEKAITEEVKKSTKQEKEAKTTEKKKENTTKNKKEKTVVTENKEEKNNTQPDNNKNANATTAPAKKKKRRRKKKKTNQNNNNTQEVKKEEKK